VADDLADLGVRAHELFRAQRGPAHVDRDEDGPPLRRPGDDDVVHRAVRASAGVLVGFSVRSRKTEIGVLRYVANVAMVE